MRSAAQPFRNSSVRSSSSSSRQTPERTAPERDAPARPDPDRSAVDEVPPTPRTGVTFQSFELSPALERGILEAGFFEPRPIQAAAIPAALSGRDVLGLAQTGTGKTAAFGIPILERLHTTRVERRRGPRALIIAPTRELARQIHDELMLVGHHTAVKCAVIFGGVPQGSQVRALKQNPDIVVACPGRLLDLYQQRAVDLSSVEVLVLDEADHMFDMGFLPDVRRILGALPKVRQNLFFSATMPKEIRGLADELLRDPHTVELSHSRPADTIEDALYEVVQERRLPLLCKLLAGPDFKSAIVFLRTKHRARRVAKQLEGSGYRAVALQGNMSQGQRERAMDGFRKGYYNVLVATDIAARGIDVAAVSHVINFDVPNTPEAYTHRIGRTGRAERTGKAFTFAAREDQDEVRAIERHLGRPIPRQALAGFDAGDAHVASTPERAPQQGQSKRQGGQQKRPGSPKQGQPKQSHSASGRPGRGMARGGRPPQGAAPARAGFRRTTEPAAAPRTSGRSNGLPFGAKVD